MSLYYVSPVLSRGATYFFTAVNVKLRSLVVIRNTWLMTNQHGMHLIRKFIPPICCSLVYTICNIPWTLNSQSLKILGVPRYFLIVSHRRYEICGVLYYNHSHHMVWWWKCYELFDASQSRCSTSYRRVQCCGWGPAAHTSYTRHSLILQVQLLPLNHQAVKSTDNVGFFCSEVWLSLNN